MLNLTVKIEDPETGMVWESQSVRVVQGTGNTGKMILMVPIRKANSIVQDVLKGATKKLIEWERMRS